MSTATEAAYALARCGCGNLYTVADRPPLCSQCRRARYGGRAPQRRVMSKYEREQRTIERRRGW